MINHDQLREFIIKPALGDLQLYSNDAVELLMFTCAVESKGGYYLKQIKGPALGIYQMEPKTYNDIWQNYIKNKPDIMLRLVHNFKCIAMPEEDRLVYDLRFATAMARLHYARVKEPLPSYDNIDDIWDYYKTYYNTLEGKADYGSSLSDYQDFITSS